MIIPESNYTIEDMIADINKKDTSPKWEAWRKKMRDSHNIDQVAVPGSDFTWDDSDDPDDSVEPVLADLDIPDDFSFEHTELKVNESEDVLDLKPNEKDVPLSELLGSV